MVKIIYGTENNDILDTYEDLFCVLDCIPGKHHIQIDCENVGVTAKQTEPTDWVNSMVAVVKPKYMYRSYKPKQSNQT